MTSFHRLLSRQIRRLMGSNFAPDARWRALLEQISATYQEVDRERALIENALAVNSEELTAANMELRKRAEQEQALLRSFTNSIPDIFFAKAMDGGTSSTMAGMSVAFRNRTSSARPTHC